MKATTDSYICDKKIKIMLDDSAVERLKIFIKERYVLRGEYLLDKEPLNSISAEAHNMTPKLTEISGEMGKFIKKRRNPNTFTVMLENYRIQKGLAPNELYERAWIDRRLYSKIMGERTYHPIKSTVIAFGLSLRLNKNEMDELLDSAGFTLSDSSVSDLVITFCLESGLYEINDVNVLLLSVDQKVLIRE
jgi:hypothetical protein